MSDAVSIPLKERGVIAVTGNDRVDFLQGLVTGDVAKAERTRGIYAAMLTAQGRFLHDFIIFAGDDSLFLDCEGGERTTDLVRRLSLYKLRSDVNLKDVSGEYSVLAFLNAPPRADETGGLLVIPDPRHKNMGWRAIVPKKTADELVKSAGNIDENREGYERLRLSMGIPDGSRDMEVGKALPLEYGFDELHGVDWEKGCYMGQEVTARMKHRSLLKKKLMPVSVEGPLPEPGTLVMAGGAEAGEMCSGKNDLALAVLRLEAVADSEKNGIALKAGKAVLKPFTPRKEA